MRSHARAALDALHTASEHLPEEAAGPIADDVCLQSFARLVIIAPMQTQMSKRHGVGVAVLPALLLACSTGQQATPVPATAPVAAASGDADAITCRLDDDRGLATAPPEFGVYYEDRYGVYVEPCIGTNGIVYNHFVYWNGPNDFFIIGNNEWTIDPLGLAPGKRGSLQFIEHPVAGMSCQENLCTAKTRLINIHDDASVEFDLTWAGCTYAGGMEVFDFDAGDFHVHCANYPVTGEACKQVVSTMKQLIAQKGLTLGGPELTDTWCD